MKSKGIIYILIATLSFAMMNYVAKLLTVFHPLQVVFFRAIGTFILIFPFMVYYKVPIIGTHRKHLIWRAVAGSLSLAAFFVALQRIPMGSAISIRYLGPIFGAILAFIYLKEKITRLQWFSFFIAFSGVLVLKGFDVRIDILSLILILFSAFAVGVVFMLLRYLGDKEHHLTIINYFMVASIIISLFFIPYWRMPLGQEWITVISIGIFGMIGQVFMTKAFQYEEASVLAPFKYMELIYALLIGYWFLEETYTLLPLFGILLILIGMILNVYSKNKSIK